MDFSGISNQFDLIKKPVLERIHNVLKHGKFIMGPEVFELEERLAKLINCKYCVTTSSGTDSLLIALMAIGVKEGDEVITTPFSWISNVEMITLLGAKPVFADICHDTYNLDANKLDSLITKKTKAIMPVSLFGQCCNMDKINNIASEHNLKVIEDAAQSFGSKYKGKYSCNLSDIGCTSFFPTKPLGGYGDGGACFTNNKNLANTMAKIRLHGQTKKNYHSLIGINGRLDTLQAAVILEKLTLLEKEIKMRNDVASKYDKLLSNSKVTTPFVSKDNVSCYAQYSILSDKRDKILKNFENAGIPVSIFYPQPIYKQQAYKLKQKRLEITEEVCQKIFSIPMHPYLRYQDQKYIANHILECV
jgi:UDP-2-acetamido-2-deoxy-ribo-hexuluronate aminotransferase